MGIAFKAFAEAVAAVLGSPSVDSSLGAAASVVLGYTADDLTSLTFHQAAQVLVTAGRGVLVMPVLRKVVITANDRTVTLQPEEARRHPACRDWIGDTIADAISSFMEDGAIVTATPSEHFFVRIAEAKGAVGAVVSTASPDGTLHAMYGPELDETGLYTASFMPVRALHDIGFLTRATTIATRPLAAVLDEPAAYQAQPRFH